MACSSSGSENTNKNTTETNADAKFTGIKEAVDDYGYKSTITYVDGRKEGWARRYFKDGSVYKESHYRENALDGPSRTYDRKGRVLEEKNYKKGNLHGIVIKYFKSGKEKFKASYMNGRPMPGYFVADYTGKESAKPKLNIELKRGDQPTDFYLHITFDQDLNSPKLYLLKDPKDWNDSKFQVAMHNEMMNQTTQVGTVKESLARGNIKADEYYFFVTHKPNKEDEVVFMQPYNLVIDNR